MSTTYVYREGSINDLPQLKELRVAAYSEFANVLTPQNWATMERNLNDENSLVALIEKATIFACTYNDKIVGVAYLVPSGNATNIYPDDWCYIRMVGVHPEYRGAGISRELTQQCIDHARASGEKIISLHTSEIMDAARHIYERLGFRKVKELEPIFGVRYWLYGMTL